MSDSRILHEITQSFIFLSWRTQAFVLALLIYGLFGSPTPDSYGWVEMAVGGLLLASLGLPDIREDGLFLSIMSACCFVPMVVGFMHGHDVEDMIRDIIPFLFLFLYPFYKDHLAALGESYYVVIAVVGFCFAARALIPYLDHFDLAHGFQLGSPADLLYLANSPEVLFCALWCLVCAFISFFFKGCVGRAVFFALLAFVPVLSMIFMVQRAGLTAVVLVLGGMLLLLLRTYPARVLVFGVVMGGICWALWPYLSEIFALLVRKTQLVGLNSRAQEWQTVLDLVFRDWVHALFGYGWGMRFENPAVGGLSVLFTHSLLSSLFLKMGVLGAGLVFTTLIFVVMKALPVLVQRRALFLILLFPLLISGGIYASYKSLGFGLILLVFFEKAHLKLEKKSSVVA
ncbi:MAG: hypothetical protein RBR86_05425 [Pseudobdellovibrionaceae bacterium]|jgi:hypothetical protein|nr:hypothetical protein [Pseudobdellovibrionaceae bacterium]